MNDYSLFFAQSSEIIKYIGIKLFRSFKLFLQQYNIIFEYLD